jgi:hypothetical protein
MHGCGGVAQFIGDGVASYRLGLAGGRKTRVLLSRISQSAKFPKMKKLA